MVIADFTFHIRLLIFDLSDLSPFAGAPLRGHRAAGARADHAVARGLRARAAPARAPRERRPESWLVPERFNGTTHIRKTRRLPCKTKNREVWLYG